MMSAMSRPCVLWTGYINPNGYGQRYYKGKMWWAHRAAFDEASGVIPDGMVVMHSCDVRACVEVTHLRLGTQSENIRDALEKGRHRTNGNELKTHCASGHEFSDRNTRVYQSRRVCRECDRVRSEIRRLARKAAT